MYPNAGAVTTDDEQDLLIADIAETGRPAVIVSAGRIFILTEDESGEFWGWSWREQDDDSLPTPAFADSIPLPWLVVVHPRIEPVVRYTYIPRYGDWDENHLPLPSDDLTTFGTLEEVERDIQIVLSHQWPGARREDYIVLAQDVSRWRIV